MGCFVNFSLIQRISEKFTRKRGQKHRTGGIGFEVSAVTGKVIAELVTTGQVPDRIRTFGQERFDRR